MQGTVFRPQIDGNINYQIDKHCSNVIVYGIDSAFMNELDEDGDSIFGEVNDIYPLTLLTMDAEYHTTFTKPTDGSTEQ